MWKYAIAGLVILSACCRMRAGAGAERDPGRRQYGQCGFGPAGPVLLRKAGHRPPIRDPGVPGDAAARHHRPGGLRSAAGRPHSPDSGDPQGPRGHQVPGDDLRHSVPGGPAEAPGRIRRPAQAVASIAGAGESRPSRSWSRKARPTRSPTAPISSGSAQIQADIDRIMGKETEASVDSELSLVLCNAYELYRWQPNALRNPGGAAAFQDPDGLPARRSELRHRQGPDRQGDRGGGKGPDGHRLHRLARAVRQRICTATTTSLCATWRC